MGFYIIYPECPFGSPLDFDAQPPQIDIDLLPDCHLTGNVHDYFVTDRLKQELEGNQISGCEYTLLQLAPSHVFVQLYPEGVDPCRFSICWKQTMPQPRTTLLSTRNTE